MMQFYACLCAVDLLWEDLLFKCILVHNSPFIFVGGRGIGRSAFETCFMNSFEFILLEIPEIQGEGDKLLLICRTNNLFTSIVAIIFNSVLC